MYADSLNATSHEMAVWPQPSESLSPRSSTHETPIVGAGFSQRQSPRRRRELLTAAVQPPQQQLLPTLPKVVQTVQNSKGVSLCQSTENFESVRIYDGEQDKLNDTDAAIRNGIVFNVDEDAEADSPRSIRRTIMQSIDDADGGSEARNALLYAEIDAMDYVTGPREINPSVYSSNSSFAQEVSADSLMAVEQSAPEVRRKTSS